MRKQTYAFAGLARRGRATEGGAGGAEVVHAPGLASRGVRELRRRRMMEDGSLDGLRGGRGADGGPDGGRAEAAAIGGAAVVACRRGWGSPTPRALTPGCS